MMIAVPALLLAFAAFLAAIVLGRRQYRSLVKREVAGLFSDPAPGVGPNELAARWDSLPEVVRRHLGYAIPKGSPAIRTARLKHDGFFRTKPNQQWLSIQGRQYFTVSRPGFVWNASVRPAPLLWIEARDSLVSGKGNMLVKLWSVFPIADARGAEIDQGSQLRWLAEALWFPYGFAGNTVQWETVDERSARATLMQDGLPVSAIFEADEEGKFVRMSADRYRDVGGGKAVLTRWVGRYGEYRDFKGLRVPSSVEVAWDLAEGEFSYVRFRVTALEYNVSDTF